MARWIPTAVVQAPTATPSLYGLVQAAVEGDTDDPRWIGGFAWDPEVCLGDVTAVDPTCEWTQLTTGKMPAAWRLDGQDPWCRAEAFPVNYVLSLTRPSVGWSQSNYEQRVRGMMEAAGPKAMEFEFWEGTAGSENQHLAASGVPTIENGTGGYSPARTLAKLEQAIADFGTGGRGMIHATVQLASLWAGVSAIGPDPDNANRLRTKLGNIVVAGSGYTGIGPLGEADRVVTDTLQWAYATGIVHKRIGDIDLTPATLEEALNRGRNQITFTAQRQAAFNFDPCTGPVAVRADLGA